MEIVNNKFKITRICDGSDTTSILNYKYKLGFYLFFLWRDKKNNVCICML